MKRYMFALAAFALVPTATHAQGITVTPSVGVYIPASDVYQLRDDAEQIFSVDKEGTFALGVNVELGMLRGSIAYASGAQLTLIEAHDVLARCRIPVRERYAGEDGWRAAGLRENPGDFYMLFVDLDPAVLRRYGCQLLASEHWLQRRTKYGDIPAEVLEFALENLPEPGDHIVRILSSGRTYTLRVVAKEGAPSPTIIAVDLDGGKPGRKRRGDKP